MRVTRDENALAERSIRRFGSIIRLRPEKEPEYCELHANVWPAVLQKLREANIRNYSIFLRDGLLFSYHEYVGDDYDADMARLAADPLMQEWWTITDPCQQPVYSATEVGWWAPMKEVFHVD
ncbi:L-rhamnose mutarotase [Streptomyces tubercidicus]